MNKLDHIYITILFASLYTYRSYFYFLRETFRHRSSKKYVSTEVVYAETRVAFHRSLDVFWRALTHEIPEFSHLIYSGDYILRAWESSERENDATNTTDGITHFVSGRGNAAAFLAFHGYRARSDTLGHLLSPLNPFLLLYPFSRSEPGPAKFAPLYEVHARGGRFARWWRWKKIGFSVSLLFSRDRPSCLEYSFISGDRDSRSRYIRCQQWQWTGRHRTAQSFVLSRVRPHLLCIHGWSHSFSFV